MKSIITTSAIVVLLLTNVQAGFDFGDVFKDMKEASIITSKESTIKVSDAGFDFGDVFKDMKKASITTSKESTIKVSDAGFHFGDVFKDLK